MLKDYIEEDIKSKIIFLYGPPAAGKYTIGKKLSELTGFGFFHNHLTVEAVKPIFNDTEEYWRSLALKTIRTDLLDLASQANKNIIFTLAYSGAVDDKQISEMVSKVEKIKEKSVLLNYMLQQ